MAVWMVNDELNKMMSPHWHAHCETLTHSHVNSIIIWEMVTCLFSSETYSADLNWKIQEKKKQYALQYLDARTINTEQGISFQSTIAFMTRWQHTKTYYALIMALPVLMSALYISLGIPAICTLIPSHLFSFVTRNVYTFFSF